MKKALILFALLGSATLTIAQQLSDVTVEKEPLVLKAIGSFYVGGEPERQTKVELGDFFPEGRVTVNQMYVDFIVPEHRKDSTSFVFIHGITLSGKTYETTPDGRMGWKEYFARQGHSVYVVDQVGIGRSGFNQKVYNQVRAKATDPDNQPPLIRISDENTAVNFRFTDAAHEPVAEAKFPAHGYREFSKQSIPFTAGTVPAPNPNFSNLAALAAELKHTVLVSHSQSGAFPLEAALLNSDGIKAIVMIEPGGTGAGYSDEQIAKISHIPVLIIYGDNVEYETGVPGHSWEASYQGWKDFAKKLQAAGGTAQMLLLPQIGIKGNSHMLMMDTNNRQIADLILAWLSTIEK